MRLHQIKKETNTTEKWKYTYADISPKKIYKRPMCTGEDVQPDYPDQNYNKIPLHFPKMDIIKRQKGVLARMWRNWKPHTQLVKVYNGAVALEKSLGGFLKG